MNYLDDETRDSYHKAPAILQMVVGILEGTLFRHGLQPELIDVERGKAILGVPDIDPELAKEIIFQINKQFKRRDNISTATYDDEDLGLISIYVTSSQDFIGLN